MIPVTKPLAGRGRRRLAENVHPAAPKLRRAPMGATPRVTVPLPVTVPGGRPFAGMDPSEPSTYVRPWNPQPGMISYLNFDGAMMQGYTDTGGVYSNPASWNAAAGGRPKRRPR